VSITNQGERGNQTRYHLRANKYTEADPQKSWIASTTERASPLHTCHVCSPLQAETPQPQCCCVDWQRFTHLHGQRLKTKLPFMCKRHLTADTGPGYYSRFRAYTGARSASRPSTHAGSQRRLTCTAGCTCTTLPLGDHHLNTYTGTRRRAGRRGARTRADSPSTPKPYMTEQQGRQARQPRAGFFAPLRPSSSSSCAHAAPASAA